jgi:hypothetical protein
MVADALLASAWLAGALPAAVVALADGVAGSALAVS